MSTVLLPPGGHQIASNKYIYISIISVFFKGQFSIRLIAQVLNHK